METWGRDKSCVSGGDGGDEGGICWVHGVSTKMT